MRLLRPATRAVAAVFFVLPLITGAASAADEKDDTKEDKPAVVQLDAVRTEPLRQTVPVIGRLVARQAGPVAARIGGPVGEMRVDVGDRVEAGQIIAVLVKDAFEWKVKLSEADAAEAEAAVKTARAAANLLAQEVRRLVKLKKSAAFSQARLDDKRQELTQAKSAQSEAEAALLRAQAQLRLAQIDLYNADIRAPYAGIVSQRHTEVGSFVQAGTAVVALIDDRNLEAEADVPASRVAGLTPGTPVELRLDGQILVEAVVRAVIPEENPLTRTRSVRFTPRFNGSLTNLATNQSVVIDIPAGEAREVVTVHKDAIIERKGKSLVYLAEEGTAQIRPITLGEAVGGRFLVKSGVKPGDQVVVRGNERLRPGQTITTEH